MYTCTQTQAQNSVMNAKTLNLARTMEEIIVTIRILWESIG
jgi:hypothetical protein